VFLYTVFLLTFNILKRSFYDMSVHYLFPDKFLQQNNNLFGRFEYI
jgi:hypothetical protein